MRDFTCPTCQAAMTTKQVNGQDVEVCHSCISVWFEQGELRNHLKNAFGVELAKAGRVTASVTGPERTCPECAVSMSHIAYDLNPLVTLDECPQCGGILAEHGELGALATHYQHAQQDALNRSNTPRASSSFNSSSAHRDFSSPFDDVREGTGGLVETGARIQSYFPPEDGVAQTLADGGGLTDSADIGTGVAEAGGAAFEGASAAADAAEGVTEASGGLLEFLLDLAGGLGDL